MTLLQPIRNDGAVAWFGQVNPASAVCGALLRFEAALPSLNAYSFHLELLPVQVPPGRREAVQSALASWFGLWTKGLEPAPPPRPGDRSVERYNALADAALDAEAHLSTVPAVQQEIVRRMRDGATYGTAHKEGGTILCVRAGTFVRSDYGESNATETFADEACFLAFLRRFYDSETSRNIHPRKLGEFEAWKLMLRLLRAPP